MLSIKSNLDDKLNVYHWELLGVVWVDVVLAAHCHRQGDVPAVGINIHLPLFCLSTLEQEIVF